MPGRELLERLRAAALEYVDVGWPIVALSPVGDRVVSWMTPLDSAQATDWWSNRAYGIGVRVGEAFDVLELPAMVGELVVADLQRRLHGSVSVFEVPRQGWLFPVTPGAPVMCELGLCRQQVRLLRRGSWVPVPPTPVVGGEVAWISRGSVPHSLAVQSSAYQAVRRTAAADGLA